MKKGIIIALAGKAKSGKDTAASIINYIYNAGTTASFPGWLSHKCSCDINLKYKQLHFADTLKDVVSTIYKIDREYFDNHEYKDEKYYVFSERNFIKENVVKNYNIITIDDLYNNDLSTYLKLYENKACIKLRTLLQYIGTEIGRKKLDDKIWIKSTLFNAVYIVEKYKFCIISDIRFQNELDEIKKLSKDSIVIKLNRNITKLSHESENLELDNFDYEIDNNGSVQKLFYNLLEIIQNL